MRTYWLSFGSEETGEHLGVAVVDVTEAEFVAARADLPPSVATEAVWVMAALQQAWREGWNPGGQALTARMDAHAAETGREAELASMPRGRLFTPEEMERFGVRRRRRTAGGELIH